jgi:hypothetical protein
MKFFPRELSKCFVPFIANILPMINIDAPINTLPDILGEKNSVTSKHTSLDEITFIDYFNMTYKVGLRPQRSTQSIAGIVANTFTNPIKTNITNENMHTNFFM